MSVWTQLLTPPFRAALFSNYLSLIGACALYADGSKVERKGLSSSLIRVCALHADGSKIELQENEESLSQAVLSGLLEGL